MYSIYLNFKSTWICTIDEIANIWSLMKLLIFEFAKILKYIYVMHSGNLGGAKEVNKK